MLTHANLLANVRAIGEALALRSDDVGVSWLPLYHDMGLIGAWLMPLYFGLPGGGPFAARVSFAAVRWLRAFHRYRGTVGAAPNFAYELAAAKVSDEDMRGSRPEFLARGAQWRGTCSSCDARSFRGALCALRFPPGSAPAGLWPGRSVSCRDHSARGPRAARGSPRTRRVRARRPRDSGPITAEAPEPEDDANVISFVSVGQPIPRHEVRIVNDRGEDAGERVEGQLWFRGPSATQGYYRNESATAALFPQGAAAGWVNSGDRAYQAEGEIYITGRVKDIIIHAGRNLYPHEIEDVVAQVPGVRKGCVVAFGAADPTTGTERLVVVAETRERDPAARARIAQAITAQVSTALGLPPDVVKVVPPNAIPKTSSGKLQRDATKKRFLSGELGAVRRRPGCRLHGWRRHRVLGEFAPRCAARWKFCTAAMP